MADESLRTWPDTGQNADRIADPANPSANQRQPSLWREDRRYISLALVLGIMVGTPFLISAFLIWNGAVLSYPAVVFFFGGSLLTVGPAALTALDVWKRSRKIRLRSKRPA